jgi:hypothetical protein
VTAARVDECTSHPLLRDLAINMHARPLSTSTSSSNFESIFNSALDAYKTRTRQHLSSHPLISSLQACDSPDAVLTVLRDQIPAFRQSQSGDETFSKWLVPTVNVRYAFSATLIDGVGLVNTAVASLAWEPLP